MADVVAELRRVPELALGSLDGAVNIAVANLLAALQRGSNVVQECVAVGNAQRARGG
jgi:hypothetical protein